ncbi:hypothetical protein P154DRAFT_574210 [Amniculicola lignicola CBS 123094]|uniref:Uncharacterized protein n=1 Tax=Amniculicola lignicola CBS 123094 TaxID=1392246 RepID=A0A6A5WKP8_9PLEO|nr:hypothetical protein P154DRAFT_574210 [Amniculicola lignicola CBS 123094]
MQVWTRPGVRPIRRGPAGRTLRLGVNASTAKLFGRQECGRADIEAGPQRRRGVEGRSQRKMGSESDEDISQAQADPNTPRKDGPASADTWAPPVPSGRIRQGAVQGCRLWRTRTGWQPRLRRIAALEGVQHGGSAQTVELFWVVSAWPPHVSNHHSSGPSRLTKLDSDIWPVKAG